MKSRRSASARDLFARPVAHRGLHACGADGPVENTIAAALAAVAQGYGIECDVQLSADGEPFVVHDDDLERLTGVRATMRGSRAADLDRLPLADGSPIPRLSTFLAAVAGATPVIIEIKSHGEATLRVADAVLGATHGYVGPLAIESFNTSILARCAGAPCPIGLVGPAEGALSWPDRCDFLSWNIDRLADRPGSDLRLPLTAWTIRNAMQASAARDHGAQIVFEGFRP